MLLILEDMCENSQVNFTRRVDITDCRKPKGSSLGSLLIVHRTVHTPILNKQLIQRCVRINSLD